MKPPFFLSVLMSQGGNPPRSLGGRPVGCAFVAFAAASGDFPRLGGGGVFILFSAFPFPFLPGDVFPCKNVNAKRGEVQACGRSGKDQLFFVRRRENDVWRNE